MVTIPRAAVLGALGVCLAFSAKADLLQIQRAAAGSVSPPAADPGLGVPEIDPGIDQGDADDAEDDTNAANPPMINRPVNPGSGVPAKAQGRGRAKSNPELLSGWRGLNLHDQRYANGGNQFTVEPPDQALCVGNGYVVESVNDVLQIWDTAGNSLKGPIDLNTFYGYPAAIVRPSTNGPSITDPVCVYDPDTQRFFHVVLTLDRVGTTSALSGKNHLDIAVSKTSDPTGGWLVYRLPVQNDGTDGTPDHGCKAVGGVHGPCLGDYPHIGFDANGLYLTTNEFNFFASGFRGSQIYGVSKWLLAAGADSIPVVLFDTATEGLFEGAPGFTVWPSQGSTPTGNEEFLLSSISIFSPTRVDDRVRLWTLSNTSSLASPTPAVTLSSRPVAVVPYTSPGSSEQKPGPTPARECLADSTVPTTAGPGCWRLLTASGGPFTNPLTRLASNDSRMQQVYSANGKVWGALGTGLNINGTNRAGVAYFVINPHSGKADLAGYLGLESANLTYPTLAVTPSGRGVLGFTVVGPNDFPSAGYASLDAKIGAGDVHLAAAGAGPQDGFTGYLPFSNRPRWGDYGAAAVDGSDVWIASEYIAQTCSLSEYLATGLTCGSTRTSLGNWATHVARLRP